MTSHTAPVFLYCQTCGVLGDEAAASSSPIPTPISSTQDGKKVRQSQVGRRSKRECPLCNKTYFKLTDHLKKTHKLLTKEQRAPLMKEAFSKMPDLRIKSE